MDITRKGSRTKLAARREPYWLRLAKGAYVGFRRGPDTWIARYRAGGKQHYQSLNATEYDDAKREAEVWFRQMGSGITRRGTVREALGAYLDWLRDQGRQFKTSEDRFKLIIYRHPLADKPLHEVTRQDFRAWRKTLQAGRKNRSVNRHVNSVKAALNRAVNEGFSGNREAWKVENLADDGDRDTAIFLTPEQRKAIIAECEPATGRFLRGLELTGARPSELANARVKDLDGDTLRLAHKKGRPPKLRVRSVVLQDAGFFKAQARNKLPRAFLFTDADGRQWERHVWGVEVRRAVDEVKAPHGASAYSFRHSRISELLQVYGVDPLTVGAQTGTSVRVIEQTYYKFIPNSIREKLRAISTS